MASERAQRHIDHLLDEAEEAITSQDWNTVGYRARSILRLDPENSDALAYLAAVDRKPDDSLSNQSQTPAPTLPDQPASFANGRYQVARFLGEGGKKKVYLAQNTTLDREVAFALIKTEGLDETSRTSGREIGPGES